jgi:hypothetical protein
LGAGQPRKCQTFEAEHGYCKELEVSQHDVERRCRQQPMLYVMKVVALPIVCQGRWFRGVAALLLCVLSCARTGLDPGDTSDGDVDGGGSSGTSPLGSSGTSATTGGMTNQPLPTSGAPAQAGTAPMTTPECVPSKEECNGRDDDCNDAVDDMPAEKCAGGGARFCVAGRMSECPKRCEVCVPGSVRICQNPFCTFWGEQHCAADGQGFGHCREADPPPECATIAKEHQQSKQLEQCCLDNGYCCLDEHDLDGDGNRREMLGACGDVTCQ